MNINKDNLIGCIFGTALSGAGTGLQTNETLQTISLIITIIGGIITLVTAAINWYKSAKKDNKITNDEIKDLTEIVNDNIKDIVDDINKNKKEDK